MRTITILVVASVIGGYAITMIKDYFTPDEVSVQAVLVERYKANPQQTMLDMSDAVKQCSDSPLHGIQGATELRAQLAKNILETISTTPDSRGATVARLDAETTRVLTTLVQRLNKPAQGKLLAYLKDLHKAGVVDCVVSTVA